MDNNYLVDIQHERLSFFTPAGEVKALNDVSIHLKEGEVLGIVGESGSGKSVTAYSLMGLTAYPGKLIGGELHFNGHEVEKMTEKDFSKMRGKEVSIIFQDPLTSLNPVYTIGNQIMEVIRLHTDADKKKAYARAVELLSLVGINEPEKRMKQYPHELSGGMRQRVVIAIALACNPDLLICDEPTTALDVTIQAKIIELIRRVQKERGISVIYITHDLGVVAKVADYVNVMYAGKIVEKGMINEIFYDPKHPYTWGLLSAMPDLDTADERLYTIPGSPPNLLNEKPGDAFAPRNQFALEIDDKADPPMFQVTDTHYAATWLLDPRAPKAEMPPELKERIARMKKEAKIDDGE